VHLFILYWGMVSFITPPVALGAFAAASMAGADAFKTGFEAMKLGGVIYIIPFFFVLNPALIGQGEPIEVVVVLVLALIGVWFISAALQGFVSFVGPLNSGTISILLRLVLFLAGLMVAVPIGVAGLSHLALTLLGFVVAILPLSFAWRAGQVQELDQEMA
jgi:TRAP-type uncharacterized transport system fused permease subunit